MYKSELKAMRQYNKQLKIHHLLPQINHNIDWFFGPRVFVNTPKILKLFTKKYLTIISSKNNYVNPEKYSNTLFFPIIMALKRNVRIKSVIIPFQYPEIQKQNDSIGAREFFIRKRHNQSVEILFELRQFLRKLSTS